MKKGIYFISIFIISILLCLMIINPNVCKNGALYGLLLSSKVIIPSIFPFSVLVLFILKSNILEKLQLPKSLCIFLLSLIGGYPIGAKVLNESVEIKKLDKETAQNMLNYSVNAGPAFIILAVGCGLLNSKKLGYILFISHILASIVLKIISKKPIECRNKSKDSFDIIDNFVLSVSHSSSATLSICSFVILFSVILNYINHYSESLPILRYISPILEVTNGTSQTKNILFISFLLGFSGVCVWFQVFGMVKNFKINYVKFILFRVLHGILSSGFTYILIKIFKVSLPTLSNGIDVNYNFTNYTPQVAFSLIIMGIIFIISLNTKNYAGNLLEDLV